jgi:hypothetical protein
MKKIIFLAAITTLGSLLLMPSCKKKNNPFEYDNSNAPATNAIVENAYMEMPNISDQAVTGTMTYYKLPEVTVRYASASKPYGDIAKNTCNVILTLDTVGSIDTLVIDWGTTNCLCNDGKNRRGKIITTWNGSYYNQGTTIKHVPVGYYVNDNKIEGEMTVTNMGNNSSGQPFYNVNINGLATLTTGEIVTYTSTRVRTFTNGYTTQLWFWDDEYDITGTANATVVNGDGYSAVVVQPLHVKVGCAFITKGVLNFTPTGQMVRVIDYGDGTCDAKFTVTINGQTYTING